MSDNAPSLPQTTDAGGAVSTAVSNKAVLELTEDEKSALENMRLLSCPDASAMIFTGFP